MRHSLYDVIGLALLVLFVDAGFIAMAVLLWQVPPPMNYIVVGMLFAGALYVVITFVAWLRGDLP